MREDGVIGGDTGAGASVMMAMAKGDLTLTFG